MNPKTSYKDKLLDPRWQKKRLSILDRDKWRCQICGDPDSTLHVHHRVYLSGKEPWDIPDDCLVTLCADCHAAETRDMPGILAGLNETLKKKFFSGDLIDIDYAFCNIEIYFASEVTASIIKHWLSNPENFKLLGDSFFQYLHDKNTPEANQEETVQ
jgi:hypothetical protein